MKNKILNIKGFLVISLVTIILVSTLNFISNDKILQEEIVRLKKWQTLAIQNSRENRVLKRLLNATDNNLKLVKTASLVNRNDTFFSKIININAGYESDIEKNMSAIN